MEMLNEDKRQLSNHSDSSTSAVKTFMQSQDRDPGKTYVSHEVNHILAACHEPHDLHLLVKLATSTGGLINDEVRKIACKSLPEIKYLSVLTYRGPILLGYRSGESVLTASARSWRDLPRHKDEDQVELDVNRSFIYYPKSRRAWRP